MHTFTRFLQHLDTIKLVTVDTMVDGRVILRSTSSDGHVSREYNGHTQYVEGVAVSCDGSILVTGSHDGTARIWDVWTTRCLHVLPNSADDVWACAISDDNKHVATGGSGVLIYIWDVYLGHRVKALAGHTSHVVCCQFSHHVSSMMGSVSTDGTTKIWKVLTGECIQTLQSPTGWMRDLIWARSNTVIATISSLQEVHAWDVSTDVRVCTIPIPMVRRCCFVSDAMVATITSGHSPIRVWDLRTCRCLYAVGGEHDRLVECTLSIDGSSVLTSDRHRVIQSWSIAHLLLHDKVLMMLILIGHRCICRYRLPSELWNWMRDAGFI